MPDRSTGRIKFFDDARGFGFIVPDDGGPDVFVHRTNFVADAVRSKDEIPVPEQACSYVLSASATKKGNGKTAVAVELVPMPVAAAAAAAAQ